MATNRLAGLASGGVGPMALYEYAKQGMEEGRQRGQQSVLTRLAGEAYSAPQADRGAVFGRMAQVDPNAALQAEQTFAKRDDDRIGQLASKARYLVNMHRAGQTQAVMGLYPQLAQEARALGLGDVPPEWSDSFVPGMEALASYGMSGAGEQFTLSPGSKRFDASGNVLAEVPFAPANAQYVDVPDGQGGSVKMLLDPRTQQFVAPNYGSGGAPQAAPTGGQGDFASLLSSVPGLRVTSQYRTPEENAALPNSVPNSYHLTGQALDIGSPTPEQRQRIGQWAAANDYEVITNYQDGHVHLEPAPGRGARTPQAGGMGYTPPKVNAAGVPAGYRQTADGNLEIIPGGPADVSAKQPKPLPASVLKMRQEARAALSVSEGIDGELARIYDDLDAGRLELGPVRNQLYRAANAAGQSSDASRRYQAMTSTFEKLRNDSLRLNNGVQTEGDAQRAWNELLGNLNDAQNVKEQLTRIRRLNERAIMLHQESMEAIDQEYGRGQPAPAGTASPTPAGGWGIQRVD